MAARTTEAPPQHSQKQRQQHPQKSEVPPRARTSRSILVLPPRSSFPDGTTAVGAPAVEGFTAQETIIYSGVRRQQGAYGGGTKMRRASTCVSVGGVVAGGSSGADLTDIMGNTFRPQQDREIDGSIPDIKTCALLPFLMRGPRVKGALPVRFSAYSCHGAATVPDAAANDSAASTVYGRCGALGLTTSSMKTADFGSGMISAGRRRCSTDHGTTDLDRISGSLQVIAAGRPLGPAMMELRRAAKSWRHCTPGVVSNF